VCFLLELRVTTGYSLLQVVAKRVDSDGQSEVLFQWTPADVSVLQFYAVFFSVNCCFYHDDY